MSTIHVLHKPTLARSLAPQAHWSRRYGMPKRNSASSLDRSPDQKTATGKMRPEWRPSGSTFRAHTARTCSTPGRQYTCPTQAVQRCAHEWSAPCASLALVPCAAAAKEGGGRERGDATASGCFSTRCLSLGVWRGGGASAAGKRVLHWTVNKTRG